MKCNKCDSDMKNSLFLVRVISLLKMAKGYLCMFKVQGEVFKENGRVVKYC